MSVSLKDIKKKTLSLSSSLGADAVLSGKLSADTVNSAKGYFSWLIPTVMLQKDGAKLCDYAGLVPFNAVDSSKFLVNMYVECNIEEDTDNVGGEAEAIDAPKEIIVPSADLCNKIVERLEFEYPFVEDTSLPSKWRSQSSYTIKMMALPLKQDLSLHRSRGLLLPSEAPLTISLCSLRIIRRQLLISSQK